MSIKNIGTYLKSSLNKNGSENLKSFNSLSIKPTQAYKLSSPMNTASPNGGELIRTRQSNLVHRHSNPVSNYSSATNLNGSLAISNTNANLKARLQQTVAAAASIPDSPANALPRIKINT